MEHERGRGVERDAEERGAWLRLAAVEDSSQADRDNRAREGGSVIR